MNAALTCKQGSSNGMQQTLQLDCNKQKSDTCQALMVVDKLLKDLWANLEADERRYLSAALPDLHASPTLAELATTRAQLVDCMIAEAGRALQDKIKAAVERRTH